MRIVANVGYRGIAQIVTFALQALTSIVLARYLSPRDYGIVGYAVIFVSFLERFSDLGIGAAVVQRQQLDRRTTDVAFTLRLALGMVAFGLALGASQLAKHHFADPVVSTVIVILSTDFLIGSAGFLPNFLTVRAQDYRRWIRPVIVSSVIRAMCACVLAIRGWGFWSIVAANVLASIASSVGFFLLGPHGFRIQWEKRIARQLLEFGAPLFLVALLSFVLCNVDNLMVGTLAGAVVLGYYALAYNWGAMGSRMVYQVVHSVLFPAFARMQGELPRLRENYLRVLEQLSAAGILVHVGLFCCAKEFLVLVLGRGGDKWLPAWHTLQILCVFGMVRLLLEPAENIVIAIGRTRVVSRAYFIATCCEIAALYPALHYGGIEGVAVIVTLSYAVQWIVYWPALKDILDLTIGELGAIVVPAAIAALFGWAASAGVELVVHTSVARLLLKVVTISVVFITVHGFLSSWHWLGEWKRLYQTLLKQSGKQLSTEIALS